MSIVITSLVTCPIIDSNIIKIYKETKARENEIIYNINSSNFTDFPVIAANFIEGDNIIGYIGYPIYNKYQEIVGMDVEQSIDLNTVPITIKSESKKETIDLPYFNEYKNRKELEEFYNGIYRENELYNWWLSGSNIKFILVVFVTSWLLVLCLAKKDKFIKSFKDMFNAINKRYDLKLFKK